MWSGNKCSLPVGSPFSPSLWKIASGATALHFYPRFFATFLNNLHFLQLYHAMGVINNFPFWPRSGVVGGQIALIHLVRH